MLCAYVKAGYFVRGQAEKLEAGEVVDEVLDGLAVELILLEAEFNYLV